MSQNSLEIAAYWFNGTTREYQKLDTLDSSGCYLPEAQYEYEASYQKVDFQNICPHRKGVM